MTVPRRGVAPLEFVLALPLLMVLFTVVVCVGRAGAARTAALGEARGRAWADPSAADPGQVLRLNHDPGVSRAEYRSGQPFRGIGLFGGREWVATATTGTHFRTWADDDLVGVDRAEGSPAKAPGTDLVRRLVGGNPDSLPLSGASLSSLEAVRFIDPAQHPAGLK